MFLVQDFQLDFKISKSPKQFGYQQDKSSKLGQILISNSKSLTKTNSNVNVNIQKVKETIDHRFQQRERDFMHKCTEAIFWSITGEVELMKLIVKTSSWLKIIQTDRLSKGSKWSDDDVIAGDDRLFITKEGRSEISLCQSQSFKKRSQSLLQTGYRGSVIVVLR